MPYFIDTLHCALTLLIAYIAWENKGKVKEISERLEEVEYCIEQSEDEEEGNQRFIPVEINHNTALLDMKEGSITLIETGKTREIGFRENKQ